MLELIKQEVMNLLNSGKAYEKNLILLEKKLGNDIHTSRNSNKAEKASMRGGDIPTIKQSDEARMNMSVATSEVDRMTITQRSMSMGNTLPKKVVYHLDPQRKLIPSDEEWHKKVLNDLENFKKENETKSKEIFDRNKMI